MFSPECHYGVLFLKLQNNPDSKVHGANMGPIWGRQDPGGPHVGPMNFAISEEVMKINPTMLEWLCKQQAPTEHIFLYSLYDILSPWRIIKRT